MSLYFFILSVISLKEEIISTTLPIFRAFFLAILLESPDMVEKSYVNFSIIFLITHTTRAVVKNDIIYGIFIIDNKQQTKYCAYVGKTVNIYKRFSTGDDAHFVKLGK